MWQDSACPGASYCLKFKLPPPFPYLEGRVAKMKKNVDFCTKNIENTRRFLNTYQIPEKMATSLKRPSPRHVIVLSTHNHPYTDEGIMVDPWIT